ncbi:E3 ubiquitin protein ligase RIE1-like isoform X2 [Silene latifolia]|uniref:E3 ubiquitin protein ligase RIE1-like isoform X2 n=1 Tax=Silene latifolia TaxID=37657 RepID=UPI003D773796
MVMMNSTLSVLLKRAALSCCLLPVREGEARDLVDKEYTKKVVTVETIFNTIIVAVSVLVLVFTAAESPNVPVRVWVGVYAVQCLVHVISIWFEYSRVSRRRTRTRLIDLEAANDTAPAADFFGSLAQGSFAYRCDSLNIMASFVWTGVGLYWVESGGKLLEQNAPKLYGLTMSYLTYDVYFAILSFIGITLFCCLTRWFPLIPYRVPTVAGQEGSSEADLNVLPKYRFHMYRNLEKPSVGAGVMVPMDISNGDSGAERVVLPEDSECCICLDSYEEGVELHALPCNHHFHATCIKKWLNIKSACPVCKYNILNWSVAAV